MKVDFSQEQGHVGHPSVERIVIEVAGLAEDVAGLIPRDIADYPLNRIFGLWEGDHETREAAWSELQALYGLPGASAEQCKTPEGRLYFWTQIRDVFNRVISAASPVATIFRPLEDLPAADAPARGSEAKWSVP
ncbi:MAG: hypothetical protein WA082_00030 [Candidatus Moraniibacteriota bacterium]